MTSANPNFDQEVRRSFAQQSIMNLIGASLSLVEPGIGEITLPYRQDLTQQNGYLHAGIVTTIAGLADLHCSFAGLHCDQATLLATKQGYVATSQACIARKHVYTEPLQTCVAT